MPDSQIWLDDDVILRRKIKTSGVYTAIISAILLIYQSTFLTNSPMLLIAYKMKFVSKQMPFIIIIYSACLLIDIISPNWLYTCKRCMPFSVVLKSCVPSRSIN